MIAAVVREAAASAKSQLVTSTLTVLMVAGMICAIMLTTGRTVGAEQEVLASIDSAGTRSILVRAEEGAGVTSDVIDRLQGITGIEWVGAFSGAVDATNSAVPDGTRVPVRLLYSDHVSMLGISDQSAVTGGMAYASPLALSLLGLPDILGGFTLIGGETYGVAGAALTPDFLAQLEPLVIVPQPDATGTERVAILIVIAETPELVAPVSAATLSVLAADDPTKISVQTSEELAELRGLVEGQLGSFSRGLVLAIMAVTGFLVAILLFGLVIMRRKDFGRRRALGATRALIISLLLTQTATLTLIGIVVGSLVPTGILIAAGDPLPGWSFFAGVGILTIITTLFATLVPAIVASRREPIRELRVP